MKKLTKKKKTNTSDKRWFDSYEHSILLACALFWRTTVHSSIESQTCPRLAHGWGGDKIEESSR